MSSGCFFHHARTGSERNAIEECEECEECDCVRRSKYLLDLRLVSDVTQCLRRVSHGRRVLVVGRSLSRVDGDGRRHRRARSDLRLHWALPGDRSRGYGAAEGGLGCLGPRSGPVRALHTRITWKIRTG